MKRLITVSTAFVILIGSLCAITLLQTQQYNEPLGTNARFDLSISESASNKDQLVQELIEMSDRTDSSIIKASTDAENYTDQRNIYYFSSSAPASSSPLIQKDNRLSWLVTQDSGKLISANELGSTPLGGTFHLRDSQEIQFALQEWADRHQLSLFYYGSTPPVADVFDFVSNYGVSIAWFSALLLSTSLVISWIIMQHRTRAIQLMGGIKPVAIHLEAMTALSYSLLAGALLGIALTVIYSVFRFDPANLPLIAYHAAPFLLSSLLFLFGVGLLFSLIARPTIRLLAARKLPHTAITVSNVTVRAAAALLAMLTIPSTIGLSTSAFSSYTQHSSLAVLKDSVAISVSTFDYLETAEGSEKFRQMLLQPELKPTVAISLVLDTAILLEPDDRSGYDEIHIVNETFLELIGISESQLTTVPVSELHPNSRMVLDDQFKSWLPPEDNATDAFTTYSYSGDEPVLGLGVDAPYGGKVSNVTNPLIVVLNNPLERMQSIGFLAPLLSTGNLFFTEPEIIQQALTGTELYSYIRSVDRFNDTSLVVSQEFYGNYVFYILAGVTSLACVLLSSWQSAAVWCQ